jgi:hypothetical protein
MHSILRELFRRIPCHIAPTPEPEERTTRPLQYPVSRSWSVETIETYSLEERKKTDPAHAWNVNLSCLDPSSFNPYSVEFTHFFDGAQRTSRIMEIPWQSRGFSTVPMFIAQIACIVLTRHDRKLDCVGPSQFQTLVEVPIRFLNRNARRDVREAFEGLRSHHSFRWVDTSYATKQSDGPQSDAIQVPPLRGYYHRIHDAEFKENLSDPNWLSNQTKKWTMKYRDAMEQMVFDHLAEHYGKVTQDGQHFRFFVKDGTLSAVRGRFVTSAIGVSKSFNTRFLEPHLQTKVMNLHSFHRTPVFKFERDARGTEPDEVEAEEAPATRSPQKHTVLSWYVRIRRRERSVPDWGLLRVEIHPRLLPCNGSADRWTADDSTIISAISAALIREAHPTSQPDFRWHNLLYPIKICEGYARSRMIPHGTVKHLFVWGGSSNE